ncbi:hypothetical protein Tco_0828076 [Tanacetum coccineum]
MMHKMKEGYGDRELTLYPTQVFSVNNWALKPNQLEEPPFIDHMLAICATDMPVVFKAPKTSSKVESVSQGTNPRAKPGHKKLSTSLKQPFVFSKEATKGGSSKAPTSSKTGHSKKRKESRVNSEARANPHLSSGNDALAASTAEADLGKSAPSDFVPQQQGINEGTKNTSYDHLFAGKGASSIARQIEEEEEEASNTIKLEDLAKLVSNVQPSFKDLDSPEDDPVIVFDDSDKDKEDEVHTTTKDTSVPKSSSPSSLPTELKDLPSKFNELTKEVKGLKQQWELPAEFVSLPIQVASFQAKLKTLDALPSLLLNVTKALNKFAQVLDSASSKAGDQTKKNAEKENPNNQQPKPTPPPATTIIPPIITTITTQMQSPPQNPQKVSSEPEREHIKKDKVKKAMSSKDAKEVSTESDFNDEITHVPGSMVESSKKKDLKIFDFVTEDGEHVYLTEEQISAQKKIEEEAKAKVVKHERKIRKEELIDLLGPDVVNKYYNDKLQYDRYCDKMLNRIAKSRITNCDILTRKGPITLKVYREDDTSEIIPDFKASDLHPGEWREVIKASELGIDLDRPLCEQDPLDRLNDLENKKRKHADDIHDFFRANKRLKLHQCPGLDDHAMTFSSLLLAKIDMRNLNPLKQMRVIERLSITQAEVFQFESLKFLQRQLFKSLKDWEVSSLQFMQRYRN